MNYTIVIDETGRRKQIENRINAAVRHCRIGKVREKVRIGWSDRGLPNILDGWKHPSTQPWPLKNTDWKQTYLAGCGCKVGSACGNAACPHRPVVIC